MAVALQHQLTAAGIGGLLKPATGVGATMAGLPTTQASGTALQLPGDGEGAATSTLTLLEPPGTALLHPALRNVKTINIGECGGREAFTVTNLDFCTEKKDYIFKNFKIHIYLYLFVYQVEAWDGSDRCWAFPGLE